MVWFRWCAVLLTDDRWLAWRRGLLGSIWLGLAVLTHVPVPPAVQGIHTVDKLVHFAAYFPLGLLLPACRIRGLSGRGACLMVIAVYGVLDELLQIPVGRTASVFDWLADLAGGGLGLWVYGRGVRSASIADR